MATKAFKAIDLYMFTNGRKVIRRVAKDARAENVGETISRMIPSYHVEWGNTAGPWVRRYFDIVKDNDISSKRTVQVLDSKGEQRQVTEHTNMVLAKEGKQVPANPRVAKAVEELTKLFNDVRDTLAKSGAATETFDEGTGRKVYVPFSEQMEDPKYWPRKYDMDAKIKTTDPETGHTDTITLREFFGEELGDATRERIMRGMMKEHGLSQAQVEDWIASRKRDHPLVGNVERARQYDIPYYRTDVQAAVDYLEGAGEVVARTKVFGQRRQKLERLIESVPDVKARQQTREIMDSLLSGRYMDDDTRAVMGLIANWSILTKMGFSAVKALGHSAWVGMMTDTRTYLGGLLDTATHYHEAKQNAIESGAILEQYKTAALKEFGARSHGVGSASSKFLGYVQFHRAYAFGRIVADASARRYLEVRALPKLKDHKSAEYYRRNLKEVFLLSDQAIDSAIETGSWTDADYDRAGKALADKTMFTMDPTELPPAWRARSENPAADFALAGVRSVTLLKGYMFKVSALLRERLISEALKGNFRPWIPFAIMIPALGELITQWNSVFHTNKKSLADEFKDAESTGWKIAEDIAHMIGISTLEHALEVIAHPTPETKGADPAKDLGQFAIGIAGSDMLNSIAELRNFTRAKSDAARMNAIKRWTRSTFPMTKVLVPPPVKKGSGQDQGGTDHRMMAPTPREF